MASKLTIALAGLAVASLPVFVDAQGTSTPQTRPEQPTTTSQQSRSGRADQNSPQHHLDEAKRVLTSLNANNVQGEARSQINELKRHFMQLETTWRASSAGAARSGASRSTGGTGATTGSATGTGSTSGSTSGTTQGTAGSTTGTTEQSGTRGSQGRYQRGASATGGDWMTHYTAINTLLEQMIGTGGTTDASMSGSAGTTAGTSSGTAGSTTGTSAGTTGSAGERTGSTGSAGAGMSASARIEGDARTKLMEFKRHLDQFHTTAMAQRAPGGEDASAASRSISSPATTSHETPEATGTTGTTSTMTGTAGTTGSTSSATAQNPQTTPQTQGTTSTQTTQPTSASATVDSAAIARLTASIDEMLRGSATTSTTAGTTTTGTGTTATGTTATGTTTSGTVGTSGTTSSTGTVCVDRAKLEALKTQLQALQNRPR